LEQKVTSQQFDNLVEINQIKIEVSPEYGRQMGLLATMQKEKMLANGNLSNQEDWLESLDVGHLTEMKHIVD